MVGCGHASSEEMNDGLREAARGAPAWSEAKAEGIEGTAGEAVGKGVGGDDEQVGSDGMEPGTSVEGAGEATKPVDERAGEVVDQAGEAVGQVGECTGRRFKKCR